MAGPEWELTISLRAMQRSRTTLEDFTLSYFPYLGLVPPEKHLFKRLDVLVWLEASVYQLDEENELLSRGGADSAGRQPRMLSDSAVARGLQQLGLHDARIEHEISQADAYWGLERSLTANMLAAGVADEHGGGAGGVITLIDVMRAHEAKSFDYRLLFLVLHKAESRPYDDALLAFLRADERLVDIGDDLTDYEDDVEANSFNIYRGFIWLYGRDAQLKLVELISELEAEHARLLAALDAPTRAHYWARHADASEQPGSGRWAFPSPIFDEAGFREMCAEHEAAGGGVGQQRPGGGRMP